MRKLILVVILVLPIHGAFAQSSTPRVDASEYAARRARLAKEIGPNAMLVVFSPKRQIRSGDQEWPFRQSDVEDNVLITETGARLLSTSSPRRVEEIERFMGR